MPVFDWTRTNIQTTLSDGSTTLSYDADELEKINPLSGHLTLPGWDLSYQSTELHTLLERYQTVSEKQLMDNLLYFLKEIIPVAEEENILMAIHPDDPPWSIFELPRIMKNRQDVEFLLKEMDSYYNGITFCTGSFGSDPNNDLIDIVDIAKDRIHFIHARNVKHTKKGSFHETSHSIHDGSIPMVDLMRHLVNSGYNGPIRPDHGRMIWKEKGKPGYGLYDRALGATYLNGIIDTLRFK